MTAQEMTAAKESPVLGLVKEAIARELDRQTYARAVALAERFAPHADAQRVFLGLVPTAVRSGKTLEWYAEHLLPFLAASCFEDLARAFARLPDADIDELMPFVAQHAEHAPLIAGGIAEHYYPGLLAYADDILAVGAQSQWVASELPFGCDALRGHEPALLSLTRSWLPLGDWACLEGIGYVIDAVKGMDAQARQAFLDRLIGSASAEPASALRMSRDAIPRPADAADLYERLTLPVLKEPPRPAGTSPVSILAYANELDEFAEDPRGHFAMTILDGLIRCKFYRNDRLAAVIEGRVAEEILKTVLRLKLVSNTSHAAWLGSELMRAEIALRHGKPYVQERAP